VTWQNNTAWPGKICWPVTVSPSESSRANRSRSAAVTGGVVEAVEITSIMRLVAVGSGVNNTS